LPALLVLSGCAKGPAPHPSLLLITIDTLRADHLGCYGYAPAQTPAIDRLAQEGIRFENVSAAAPLTLPSHATILTGLYPPAHGVRDNGAYRLPADIPTLATTLKHQGYRTAAFVGAYVLAARFGLERGFEVYDDHFGPPRGPRGLSFIERRAAEVANPAIDWLERLQHAQRFFAWVHFYDPHAPREPPPPYAGRFADPYDGEIAYADSQVGRLLETLQRLGRERDTLVVLTADHGEGLGQHREVTHGLFVYASTIRVPLILRLPGGVPAAAVRSDLIGAADLMPSVLERLGFAPPARVQGRSFWSRDRAAGSAEAQAYSESLFPYLNFRWSGLASLRSGSYKLIRAPHPELYDLAADPNETRNRYSAEPAIAARLLRALERYDSTGHTEDAQLVQIDGETAAKLRALGYAAGAPLLGEAEGSPWDGPDPKQMVGVWEIYQRALNRLREDNYSEGESLLVQVVRQDPENILARVSYAGCLFRASNYAAAAEQYRAALRSGGNPAIVRAHLGRALRKQGELEPARLELAAALDLDPTFAPVHVDLAYLALARRDLPGAERSFGRAIELDPLDPEPHVGLGRIHLLQRDDAAAESEYRKALKLDPRDLEARVQLGNLRLKQRRIDEARTIFYQALADRPDSIEALLGLGNALAFQGDLSGAVAKFEAAVDKAPLSAAGWSALGFARLQLGQTSAARAALTKSLALEPDQPQVRSLLAQLK
jgi:arylsulfatase A-like enzyme/Flp pilus assembly protein TadD